MCPIQRTRQLGAEEIMSQDPEDTGVNYDVGWSSAFSATSSIELEFLRLPTDRKC